MANLMSDSLSFYAAALQGNAATAITYRRGGNRIDIAATRAATGQQIDTLNGELSWSDQDWLIPASVLTLGEPERGDRIEIGDEIYKVLPPEGQQHWRWSDSHRKIYRVHTKRVSA